MRYFILVCCFSCLGVLALANSSENNIQYLETKLETATDTVKANTLNALAAACLSADQQKAMKYANEAIKLSRELSYQPGVALAQYYIAYIHLAEKKFDPAIEQFNQSLQTAVLIKEMRLMQKCYEGLSLAYAGTKNFQKAYECHQLYANLKDELFKQENEKILKETLQKYEVEKKESSLKQLQQEIDAQQQELHKQKRLRNYSMFGFIGLLVLAGGFWVYMYYFKNGRHG